MLQWHNTTGHFVARKIKGTNDLDLLFDYSDFFADCTMVNHCFVGDSCYGLGNHGIGMKKSPWKYSNMFVEKMFFGHFFYPSDFTNPRNPWVPATGLWKPSGTKTRWDPIRRASRSWRKKDVDVRTWREMIPGFLMLLGWNPRKEKLEFEFPTFGKF